MPQREPLGPADAEHAEGEAQLVDHLYLGNLLLPVAAKRQSCVKQLNVSDGAKVTVFSSPDPL